MKLNQEGSTQLFLCLVLLMSLSGLTAITFNKVTLLKKNRIRLKTLVCLRKAHFHQSNFIYDINKVNRLIQIAYFSSKVPIPQVVKVAEITMQILKIKQQINLIQFFKNIYELEECSKVTKMNLGLNLIYKMKAKTIFQRNLDQTTMLTTRKKKTYIYFTNERISLQFSPIVFKSTFEIDNRFDKKVKVQTKGFEI